MPTNPTFLGKLPVSDGKLGVVIEDNNAKSAVFDEQIHAGSAVGESTIDAGLTQFNRWQFQVTGVDADDDVTIQVSFDKVNFIKPGLVDIMTGALIDQTAANVEAVGVYRFGTLVDQVPINLAVVAIKVVRETAVGGNLVTVNALGTVQ